MQNSRCNLTYYLKGSIQHAEKTKGKIKAKNRYSRLFWESQRQMILSYTKVDHSGGSDKYYVGIYFENFANTIFLWIDRL
jgi:hypothetical protein